MRTVPVENSPIVVLGGGLSGVAAAYTLGRGGFREITILERGSELGGLAGSFERDGHFYPLAYHHILHRDRTLQFFLELVGALSRVRWRKIRMFFRVDERLYDLANPIDFLRFPMALADKLRFVRLMLRAFGKSDWSDWLDRSAADLVDEWGGPGVRRGIFDPLCRLKFELPAVEVSGAWLGARLHFKEGSAPLGYIPDANWTKVLCGGLTRLVEDLGIRVRLRTPVARLLKSGDRIVAAELAGGERVNGETFVSTLPTEAYFGLGGGDETPYLGSIRYSSLVSLVCATRRKIAPDFYWMNLASLDRAACGIFMLNSLNPSIGAPGESCINFVTHLQGRHRPFFQQSDEQLFAAYSHDFRVVFGFDLDPIWTNVARVPLYSPVFRPGYRNPPVRSSTWRNLYFAGNYRTFPSVVSTGTALGSGVETGQAILRDHALNSDLPAALTTFSQGRRLRSAKS